MQLILPLKEIGHRLVDVPPNKTSAHHSAWQKADHKGRAIIELTLSSAHLEQVQHASTAKRMRSFICDIFERHTLLNKLAARLQFYTARMNDKEKALAFAARVRQLAAILMSTSATIENSEMAMAFLNGLLDRFGILIALAADHVEDDEFSFNFVQSRCLQEEQRCA